MDPLIMFYKFYDEFFNTGLNMYIFLSPERLFSRKDVTLDKLNFRPHIRQNFVFVKNQDIKN